jgi:hypothetical protein
MKWECIEIADKNNERKYINSVNPHTKSLLVPKELIFHKNNLKINLKQKTKYILW